MVLVVFKPRAGSELAPFFFAFYAASAAALFTVLEGFWLGSLFNALEHLSIAAAAAMFLWGVARLAWSDEPTGPRSAPDAEGRPSGWAKRR